MALLGSTTTIVVDSGEKSTKSVTRLLKAESNSMTVATEPYKGATLLSHLVLRKMKTASTF